MAGKTARSNEKRKARYKSHPSRLASNVERRCKSHVTALQKKLRKFARYVQAGKMTEAQFNAAKERIEKEIRYTQGELPRPAPNYSKGRKRRNAVEAEAETGE